MSYLVLARKYRPTNFADLVGQEHVVQALVNALTQKRLHHAYFFTGTRGVGKTTISRILAKSLNCVGVDGKADISANPCGKCEVCRAIDRDNFPDYTELDAASNRGVDEIQHLLEQAVYKPVEARFKIFMIDEVHMLTTHAFNAMLKTLEEPPEYLKFVLATTDPQKVPVTVLSRCLQFNLRPIIPEIVFAQLKKILTFENIQFEELALKLLANSSFGSIRDALSLTEQAIAFGENLILTENVRKMLGSIDRDYVVNILNALALSDGAEIIKIVEDLRFNGLSANKILEDLTAWLHKIAVFQVVQKSDNLDFDSQEIEKLSKLFLADEIQFLFSICLQGRNELNLAPDEYIALTMTLLRLLVFKPKKSLVEVKSQNNQNEQNNQNKLKSEENIKTDKKLELKENSDNKIEIKNEKNEEINNLNLENEKINQNNINKFVQQQKTEIEIAKEILNSNSKIKKFLKDFDGIIIPESIKISKINN